MKQQGGTFVTEPHFSATTIITSLLCMALCAEHIQRHSPSHPSLAIGTSAAGCASGLGGLIGCLGFRLDAFLRPAVAGANLFTEAIEGCVFILSPSADGRWLQNPDMIIPQAITRWRSSVDPNASGPGKSLTCLSPGYTSAVMAASKGGRYERMENVPGGSGGGSTAPPVLAAVCAARYPTKTELHAEDGSGYSGEAFWSMRVNTSNIWSFLGFRDVLQRP